MITHQPDLFGTPPPSPCPVEGLQVRAEVLTRDEEAAVIQRIDAAGLEPFKFQGWLGKRLTASFGSAYDYTRGAVLPAPPMPDWLLPLRERLARWAGLEPERLTQALVIRYDPGAGIGWHRDRPQYGTVIGVSLGAAETMRLRRRRPDGSFDRFALPLLPREAYLLDGAARSEWEHSIAPVEHARWSVTFRTLRDQRAIVSSGQ